MECGLHVFSKDAGSMLNLVKYFKKDVVPTGGRHYIIIILSTGYNSLLIPGLMPSCEGHPAPKELRSVQ